jgi:hypothetical protein
MARTSLWFDGRGGLRPEDEDLITRVRARTTCMHCQMPQVVEDGVCLDCGWRGDVNGRQGKVQGRGSDDGT